MSDFKIHNIFLFLILFAFIKEIRSLVFLDLIKLPFYDSYFVVLDSGLYLYNFINLDCSLLYKFNDAKTSNDKMSLNELVYENDAFIFCLVNEYLFIFNEKNNRTIQYKIEDIDFNNVKYINILPYKYEYNNISFIIVYNIEPTKITFLYYNYSLRDNINTPKEINFDNINIKNNMLKCLIKPLLSKIFCYFYYQDTNHYLSLATYSIEDMNINPGDIFNSQINDYISKMLIVSSYNNKFFLCIAISSSIQVTCYLNNGQSAISEGNYFYIGTGIDFNFRNFYCNDTGDFLYVSGYQSGYRKINSFTELQYGQGKFIESKGNIFSIIYHKSKGYELVYYYSFTRFGTCNEIKILYEFQRKYYPECPNDISYKSTEILYFCEAKCSEEKPLEKIEYQNCVNFCGINDMDDKICISKYKEKDNSNLILKNIKQDIITINFNKNKLYNDKQKIIIEERNTKFIKLLFSSFRISFVVIINLVFFSSIIIFCLS